MADGKRYYGQNTPTSDTSPFNAYNFVVEQLINRMSTATLVQVKKNTNKGEVKEVGRVDVLPLVNLLDGKGQPQKHEIVYNIPYFRVQGGASKAIIMDPKADDIGVAVFADRDISSVKSTKKQSNPGSRRRFNMSDAMFFPCFLGAKPSCYLRFTDDDEIILSPDDQNTFLTLTKDKATIRVGNSKIEIETGKITLTSAAIDHVQS